MKNPMTRWNRPPRVIVLTSYGHEVGVLRFDADGKKIEQPDDARRTAKMATE